MLNRAAFKFAVDINRVSSVSTKPATSTTSTSFLNTIMKMAQAKEALNVTAVAPQAKAIPFSKKADIKLDVPHLLQYANECGNTSLAMILKYFDKDVSNYHNWFSSDAIGHSPGELAKLAQSKGMTVRQKENGTLEDLAKLVDMGNPALVLGINGGGDTTSLEDYLNNFVDNANRAHWKVVTGYKRDDLGKITHVYCNDPNSSTTQCISAANFMTFWNNNLVPDGHRYFMGMAPSGTYRASSLVKMLPTDKLDKWYDLANDTYKNVYSLIKAGKSVKKAVASAIDKLEDAYDEVAEFFDDAGDTISDAWDEVSGWFS